MAKISENRIDLLRPEFGESNNLMQGGLATLMQSLDPINQSMQTTFDNRRANATGLLNQYIASNDPNADGFQQGLDQLYAKVNGQQVGVNQNDLAESMYQQQKQFPLNQALGLENKNTQDTRKMHEAYMQLMRDPTNPNAYSNYLDSIGTSGVDINEPLRTAGAYNTMQDAAKNGELFKFFQGIIGDNTDKTASSLALSSAAQASSMVNNASGGTGSKKATGEMTRYSGSQTSTPPDSKAVPGIRYSGSLADNIKANLIPGESSGVTSAEMVTKKGNTYGGLLQFGEARLKDFANYSKSAPMSVDQFRALPADKQDIINNWHIEDYIKRVKDHPAIGKVINGTKVTVSGAVAAAHLGGFSGMQSYLNSNGTKDPYDDNNVRISDYMKKYGGIEANDNNASNTLNEAAQEAGVASNTNTGAEAPDKAVNSPNRVNQVQRNPANYLKMTNGSSIRKQELSPQLSQTLGFLEDMKVKYVVNSGGQPEKGVEDVDRKGSPRHNHGNAADGYFEYNGKKLNWDNAADKEKLTEIIEKAGYEGILGIGAGNDYMGNGHFHMDVHSEGSWGQSRTRSDALPWVTAALDRGKERRAREGYTGGGGGSQSEYYNNGPIINTAGTNLLIGQHDLNKAYRDDKSGVLKQLMDTYQSYTTHPFAPPTIHTPDKIDSNYGNLFTMALAQGNKQIKLLSDTDNLLKKSRAEAFTNMQDNNNNALLAQAQNQASNTRSISQKIDNIPGFMKWLEPSGINSKDLFNQLDNKSKNALMSHWIDHEGALRKQANTANKNAIVDVMSDNVMHKDHPNTSTMDVGFIAVGKYLDNNVDEQRIKDKIKYEDKVFWTKWGTKLFGTTEFEKNANFKALGREALEVAKTMVKDNPGFYENALTPKTLAYDIELALADYYKKAIIGNENWKDVEGKISKYVNPRELEESVRKYMDKRKISSAKAMLEANNTYKGIGVDSLTVLRKLNK